MCLLVGVLPVSSLKFSAFNVHETGAVSYVALFAAFLPPSRDIPICRVRLSCLLRAIISTEIYRSCCSVWPCDRSCCFVRYFHVSYVALFATFLPSSRNIHMHRVRLSSLFRFSAPICVLSCLLRAISISPCAVCAFPACFASVRLSCLLCAISISPCFVCTVLACFVRQFQATCLRFKDNFNRLLLASVSIVMLWVHVRDMLSCCSWSYELTAFECAICYLYLVAHDHMSLLQMIVRHVILLLMITWA